MPKSLSLLCVHGVSHEEADPSFKDAWRQKIHEVIAAIDPALADRTTCDFLDYDDLFAAAPLDVKVVEEAFKRLVWSGLKHSIGDLFSRSRGICDLPSEVRWTAGMVAQWASVDRLRADLRGLVEKQMSRTSYDAVLAHSLGSLLCYDAFARNDRLLGGKVFASFGSQIGNPFVRDTFGGRLVALPTAKRWYHLFNPSDIALTAQVRIAAPNFQELATPFDVPNDIMNHSALYYLGHESTQATLWRTVTGAGVPRSYSIGARAFTRAADKPRRRALLVGINDYPDPANRLDGCVNDNYLVSEVLQEAGFQAEDVRMLLNDRATAVNIRERMHWLLDDAADGDMRVLFYSGHGAQLPAYGPSDEIDHLDECLVPFDFDWTSERAITDKWFHELYSQLPYGAKFVAVFDCCHSGGMTRQGGQRVRGLTPPDDIRHRMLRWDTKHQQWERRTLEPLNRSLARTKDRVPYLDRNGATVKLGRAIALRGLPARQYDRVRDELGHFGPYMPLLFEACTEDELSYEYRVGTASYGAFTYAMATTLRAALAKQSMPTPERLVADVGGRLSALRYEQTPQVVGPAVVLTKPLAFVTPSAAARAVARGRNTMARS